MDIQITDATGRLLSKRHIESSMQIQLNPGIYFISNMEDLGKQDAQVIVVN